MIDMALASDGQPWIEPNFMFLRKHVDYPKTNAPNANAYCNKMMQIRGIYGKPVNTFIHEPVSKINSICKEGGTPKIGGLHESKVEFRITQCVLPGSYPRNCKYRAAIGNTRIRVGCEDWLPVHLEPTYLPSAPSPPPPPAAPTAHYTV
uniref:Ribonuclease A-domain domain-containing protein n=1 Tax=Chrysemys picta bellii TaxID=8478 RepID=A0A8C3I0H5_CHRPI